MARSWFGGTHLDVVLAPYPFGQTSRGKTVLARLVADTDVVFWDEEEGGSKYTDLLLGGTVPTAQITSDADGFMPRFQAPDGVLTLWADAGFGRRFLMVTTDGAIDLSTQLSTRIPTAEKGQPSGVATLDASGRLVESYDAAKADTGVFPAARIPTDLNYVSVVNVKGHGAVGDGVADDTAAIQAALNAAAGGACYLPPGTYLCGTLIISAGTTLCGSGFFTTIKAANALDADLVTNSSGASDITIRDLRVDGNRSTMTSGASARGIYLISCARVLLTRLHVHDVEGHGIHLSNEPDIEGQCVSDTTIERCGSGTLNSMGSCFATTEASGLTLTNVQCYDTAKAGFRLSGKNITLNGCIARRCANGGVVPVSGGHDGITINGGVFSDNGTFDGITYGDADGIRLVGAKNITLNGPVCSGNQGAGVAVINSTTSVTINGGIYKNNGRKGGAAGAIEGRDGISVVGDTSAPSGIIIVGVRAHDDQGVKTQQYGVRLRGSVDDVILSACDLRGNLTGPYRNVSSTAAKVSLSKVNGLATEIYDPTSSAVTGTTVETALKSFTLPAGQLGRRNGFRLRAFGTVSGVAGTKVIRVNFGAITQIAVSMAAGATSGWAVEWDIYNTASGNQRSLVRGYEGTALDVMSPGGLTVDTLVDVTVAVTATLGNAADTVTCQMLTVEPI